MDASEVLFPPFDSPQQLAKYAGTYYSDELDADYKLRLEANNLIVQISEDLEAPLTAEYADFLLSRRSIFPLLAMIKEKSRDLFLTQPVNERLKVLPLSDGRIIGSPKKPVCLKFVCMICDILTQLCF
ncbi:MAG: hypothetical protein M3525_11615 [Acidobacteriota bacterium]|nr:hypothetical protein [Acidobacteriota bacterium]